MTRLALVLLLLAAPAWAQPPNRLADVERVAAADAARFACAHTDRPCAYAFIEALVCDLRQSDTRWAMNGRRGDPARPSWDALAYCSASGPATDPTGACRERIAIVDVIAGAGGDNPRPTWQVFGSDATPGAWLVPACSSGGGAGGDGGGGAPAGADVAAVLARLDALGVQVTRLSAQLNVSHAALAADVAGVRDVAAAGAHDAGIAAAEILVVKDWLAKGLAVRLSARLIGTVSGEATVRP